MMRLRRLTIEQFKLIEHADIVLDDGFTVFSGETGSGKTMLLGALAFALGSRASSNMVSADAGCARVTLVLESDDPSLSERTVITRETKTSGKSRAYMDGRLVTAAELRALGERVVDVVGQHEQQRLLSGAYQRDLLDRFAGAEAQMLAARAATVHARVTDLEARLADARETVGQTLADYTFACSAVREIDDAAVHVDEEALLRERRAYLANAERIATALSSAREALSGAEGSVIEALGGIVSALSGIARFGDCLRAFVEAAGALQSDAAELAAGLARACEEVECDPHELDAIGARLDLLEKLKRKYGGSLEAVLAERTRFGEMTERFSSRDDRIARYAAALEDATRELHACCVELTALRLQAARLLEQRVAEELHGLEMPAARLVVRLDSLARIGRHGAEHVTFMLAPNPGAPAHPLAEIASGGELSRMLLAVIAVLADQRERTTLVFDEIDAGIGGAAAGAVGTRLGALAPLGQLLCVTHSAQIAAWATTHYVLRKRLEERGASIIVERLESPAAVREEIARMLSGAPTQAALQHAEALLQNVWVGAH